jgi:hypothetical protein
MTIKIGLSYRESSTPTYNAFPLDKPRGFKHKQELILSHLYLSAAFSDGEARYSLEQVDRAVEKLFKGIKIEITGSTYRIDLADAKELINRIVELKKSDKCKVKESSLALTLLQLQDQYFLTKDEAESYWKELHHN